MELSIDESDERLALLDWSEKEIKMIQSKLFASASGSIHFVLVHIADFHLARTTKKSEIKLKIS